MEPELASYDHVIVAFSGGKDSLACLLHLFELGVSRDKIELWHHDVDGREGSTLMDWPCTRDYCLKVAAALGVRIYFSWKVGGIEREMSRLDAPTAPTKFEVAADDALSGKALVSEPTEEQRLRGVRVASVGGGGPRGTRLLFPQVSPDLKVRWCSSYVKIDVGACALRNQARFDGRRTLFVTGERAEESPGRAKYEVFERHRSDGRDGRKRRHVDHWRPVKTWTEREVWGVIRRHGVAPHPAYRLGWGRVSCAKCIFGNPNQWASARVVDPQGFHRVAVVEALSGKTIHRKLSVVQQAEAGSPYEMDSADIRAAMARDFTDPPIVDPAAWESPRGAYGDSCGPT